MNHVEPERELTQFHGRGVDVHTIDIIKSDMRFYLLQLFAVLVRIHMLPELLLPVGEVCFRDLVDGFVMESGSTHGRFQDFKV